MDQAEAVYAATKSLNDDNGGFKADSLEDSKVKGCRPLSRNCVPIAGVRGTGCLFFLGRFF